MGAFAKITATAGYVPERVVTNEELADLMETSDEWIVSHTGIQTRHYAMNQENTSDLSTRVGQKLIKESGVSVEEIDLIIISTITPDSLTPSTAAIVQGKLHAKNAMAFDLSAACAGFVYAMSVADKMMRSGLYRHAIVISAEVNSKMMDFTDRTSTVFFGDGAGGALLTRTNNETEEFLIDEIIETDGTGATTIHSGRVQPLSEISKTNFPTTDAFYQDGRSVFQFATGTVPVQMKTLLARNQLNETNLAAIICHQANLRIIEKISQTLMISMNMFPHTVEKFGNTSSAGIPLTLATMGHSNQPILLTGFGAGLAYGSILIRM